MGQVPEFLGGLWQQYGSAHPILSHIVVALIAPWLWTKAEESIPAIVDWAEARQEKLLKRAGLSEAQLISVEEHEAADTEAAAAELRKRIAARKAALDAAPKSA